MKFIEIILEVTLLKIKALPYIRTYILYCYLSNGAFQEQLFKLLKLLITIQLKLIKFKKHLQHCLNFVVEKNTKNK